MSGNRSDSALAGLESDEQVVETLVSEGNALGELGRTDEQIAIYDEIVRRFADRSETLIAEQVAQTLVDKG